MRRAAIYSRYSTDLQSESSIADQEAVARDYAMREGLDVVATYSDAALSGGSMFGRDGLQDLLLDARAGRFDVIVVEELDRLSRDMEDLAGIHKRMNHLGIEIRAIHEGVANTITVGLRGLVGQLYREDLAHKTRRGMRGKVDAGMLAAGGAYGYQVNPLEPGRPTIVPEQAEIVTRIFTEYANGQSSREIAAGLNADGIPGPRGSIWAASAIYGWEKRGTGILRNPLYVGRIVWNRTRFTKDPDTGRRVSRVNDEKDRVTKEAPEFRIVDQALFDVVQAALKERTQVREAPRPRKPTRLLSGLLKCGSCGGGMSSCGKDKSGKSRLVCTRHTESRACPDPKTFYAEWVEELVLDTLRRELQDPRHLVEYVKAYNEARQEFARDVTRRRSMLERRIRDLDGEIGRMLQLLIKGIGSEERIGAEMKTKEAELQAAKSELEREPPAVDIAILHPHVIKQYERQLGQLQQELSGDIKKAAHEIGAAMRELIESVTVYRDGEGKRGVRVVIQGKLRKFLDNSPTEQTSVGAMVAGARFDRSHRLSEPLFELAACA